MCLELVVLHDCDSDPAAATLSKSGAGDKAQFIRWHNGTGSYVLLYLPGIFDDPAVVERVPPGSPGKSRIFLVGQNALETVHYYYWWCVDPQGARLDNEPRSPRRGTINVEA